ncbi:GvpL/GvpF family gas vesicle protein [Neobacillus sp. M.A.Huq-85]|nr:GvpL/GvpF family gas vesicle protein [Neobacillus cucumis]
MSTQGGIYVFCAIPERNPKQFGTVFLNGEESKVYTIHHKQVAIVVAKVNDEVLPDRKNLFAHQNKISEVMKEYCLIPFSFGNVFHAEEDVLLICQHLTEEFEKLFSLLENKIEVGLKIFPKQEWIEQEMKKDSVLIEWKKAEKNLSNPAAFYDQIQLGERAQNFVLLLQEEVEKKIYEPLSEIAEAGKLNNTIPGKVFLNAAFLVDLTNEKAFDQKVNDLYELWKEKVDFKYTGPWPVYNFVNIRLRIEGNS